MKDLNVIKPETPYVGLKPFDESERGVFFGRDDDADRLVNVLFASNLTVVHALSGVGKTSLLKTLVVPTLRTMGVTTVYVDRWDRELDQGIWLGLCRIPQAPPPDGDESLSHYIERLVRQRRDDPACDDPTVVLILDQFEEVLLRGGHGAQELMVALGELERSRLEVHILISMREEFLARLQAYDRYFSAVLRHTYPLGHLDEDRVRQAIVGPAQEVFDTPVETALVEALTVDLARQSDREEDSQTEIELPFMQLVCTRLWEARGKDGLTLALYESLGRREGIITSYLEEVTGALAPVQRDALSTLVKFLAPPSGVKVSYSRRDLVSMAEELKTLPRHVDGVLDHLVDRRILSTREREDEVLYQLYHDAFIDVLRSWARDYRMDRDTQLRAAEYAAEVERKNARMRKTVWTAALIAAGMLLLAGIMAAFWQGAESAKAQADQALTKEAEVTHALRASKEELLTQQAGLDEYRQSTIACIRRSDDCARLMLASLNTITEVRELALGLQALDQVPDAPGFDLAETQSIAALGLWIRDAIERMQGDGPHSALRPPQFERARVILLQRLDEDPKLALNDLGKQLEKAEQVKGTDGGQALSGAFLRGWLLLVLHEPSLAQAAFEAAPDSLHAAAAKAYVQLRVAAEGTGHGSQVDVELVENAGNEWQRQLRRLEVGDQNERIAAVRDVFLEMSGRDKPKTPLGRVAYAQQVHAMDLYLRLAYRRSDAPALVDHEGTTIQLWTEKNGSPIPHWEVVTDAYGALLDWVEQQDASLAWRARIYEMLGAAMWEENKAARSQKSRRRMLRETIAVLTHSLSLDPGVVRVLWARGRAWRRLAQKIDGEDAIDRAARRVQPACNALADLEAARAGQPDDPAVNEELGYLYKLVGRYGRALNYYAAASTADNTRDAALVAQSRLLATPPPDAGDEIPADPDRALMLARQACNVRLSSMCTEAMARAYAAQGRWASAVDAQLFARNLTPGPKWRRETQARIARKYENKEIEGLGSAPWDLDLSVCRTVELAAVDTSPSEAPKPTAAEPEVAAGDSLAEVGSVGQGAGKGTKAGDEGDPEERAGDKSGRVGKTRPTKHPKKPWNRKRDPAANKPVQDIYQQYPAF